MGGGGGGMKAGTCPSAQRPGGAGPASPASFGIKQIALSQISLVVMHNILNV